MENLENSTFIIVLKECEQFSALKHDFLKVFLAKPRKLAEFGRVTGEFMSRVKSSAK